MRNLERRYRWLLKVLPVWYRQDREEEMVAIFLADRTDDLDLEHGWPGWGEAAAMFGLAVRTRFAAGSAPGGTVWRGEVVRALGMLGLLLSVFYAGSSVTNAVQLYNDPVFTSAVTWTRVFDVVPILSFVALLGGRRTVAKVAAFVAMVPWTAAAMGQLMWWALFQLPTMVAFVCLCLGFHREAPIPPARRLAWWGGGALLLGVAGGLIGVAGVLLAAVAVVIMRVVAFVRGDFVLGRALSWFAVVLFAPVAVLLGFVRTELFVPALVVAALLVISAAAPVRRVSVPRSRLP